MLAVRCNGRYGIVAAPQHRAPIVIIARANGLESIA